MNKPMTPYYVEPEDLSTTDRTRREDFTQRGIVHKPVYLAADVDVELTALRQQLAVAQARIVELEQQLAELQEWKRIILGTGTDQEAVIRLAATEYTKIAVQCWKDKVDNLEQQFAEMTAERNAAETRNENYRMKLNASDSVIAQLSEHLAEDQAEITRLQEKP